MSTSSRRKQNIELASFHAAFLADDTLVTIVPTFDYPSRINLLSASSVGPLKAGIPTNVPLWLAMLLQQRSLCSLHVPEWLQTDHLTQVKQFEMTEQGLTPSAPEDSSEAAVSSSSTATSNSGNRLPFYYAEVGQRFTSAKTHTEAAQAPQASNLVLQDIALIRLDKLRQQFQMVSQNEMHNPNLTLQVPGIASAELVQMKPMIQQALNDQRFLATSAAAAADADKTQSSRRNKTAAGDGAVDEGLTQTEVARPNNALRSRIRRFRR